MSTASLQKSVSENDSINLRRNFAEFSNTEDVAGRSTSRCSGAFEHSNSGARIHARCPTLQGRIRRPCIRRRSLPVKGKHSTSQKVQNSKIDIKLHNLIEAANATTPPKRGGNHIYRLIWGLMNIVGV